MPTDLTRRQLLTLALGSAGLAGPVLAQTSDWAALEAKARGQTV